MTSPEKVLEFLDELQTISDQEIAEAIPVAIPVPLLRLALAGMSSQVPEDPDELDGLLTQIGEFCLSLRSDTADEPAAAA